MGLWDSGETKWQLLCWSFFFLSSVFFFCKRQNKIKHFIPVSSRLPIFLVVLLPPPLSLLPPTHPFPLSPEPCMMCVCIFDISLCAWVCVSSPRLTPSYLPKETGLQGGYGNRPPPQRDFGRCRSYHLWSVICHCPVGRRGTYQMTGPDPAVLILEAVLPAVMWYYYLPSFAFNIGQDEHMENYL